MRSLGRIADVSASAVRSAGTHSAEEGEAMSESAETALPEGRPVIREMTIDDLSEVFHIGEEIFTAEYAPSLYRTWDEYEITTLFNSDSKLCLVAEAGELIQGFALGTTVEKHHSPWKYGYLVWLGVRKGVQQGGVGERLFREIRRRMKEQGVRMILIDTAADNLPAIRFFEKQGFGNIQKHVYMTLNLDRRRKGRKGGKRE